MESPRRCALPSVDRVLRAPSCAMLVERYGRDETVRAVREVLAELRAQLHSQTAAPVDAGLEETVQGAARLLERRHRPALRPVFNLTGTVVHTNLGRAVLGNEAIAAVQAAAGAVNLEYDLDAGRRGDRDTHVEGLLCELTGAEAATVVNNNAAAVLLTLAGLAKGAEVLVSRGELIEIGGSFRMPDVMAEAGCRLKEVGTTNRTHLKDYRAALSPEVAAVLKVHRSNFTIEGFTSEPEESELAALAHAANVAFIVDLGSGSLVDLTAYGLAYEPTVTATLAHGADVVTFSGDKLLGGPQAGIIVGANRWIEPIRRHPLKRALRVDKLTIAALTAVLQLYRDPARVASRVPVLRLLCRPADDIAAMAERLLPWVQTWAGEAAHVSIAACQSQFGSGARPADRVASTALRLAPSQPTRLSEADIAARLRRLPVPVIGRIEKQAVVLDLRCLEDEQLLARQLEASRLQP